MVASKTTGQKPTDPNRIGDISEYYAVTWLWDNGYEVFMNAGATGAVDMIAVDKSGKSILIDVKTMQKDYRSPTNVYSIRRVRSKEQRKLGVHFLAFNPETRKLHFVKHQDHGPEVHQHELF